MERHVAFGALPELFGALDDSVNLRLADHIGKCIELESKVFGNPTCGSGAALVVK